MTADELLAARDALVRCRNSGTLSVRYADGSAVAYRSDAEMASALAAMERMLATMQAGPRPTSILFNTSKGV